LQASACNPSSFRIADGKAAKEIEMINENKIKIGDKVKYGIFKDIVFVGFDDDKAYLEDKYGNVKEVYKSLFLKYSEILEG